MSALPHPREALSGPSDSRQPSAKPPENAASSSVCAEHLEDGVDVAADGSGDLSLRGDDAIVREALPDVSVDAALPFTFPQVFSVL